MGRACVPESFINVFVCLDYLLTRQNWSTGSARVGTTGVVGVAHRLVVVSDVEAVGRSEVAGQSLLVGKALLRVGALGRVTRGLAHVVHELAVASAVVGTMPSQEVQKEGWGETLVTSY